LLRVDVPQKINTILHHRFQVSDVWLGFSNAIAAGMMLSASFSLMEEGVSLEADGCEQAACSSLVGWQGMTLFIAHQHSYERRLMKLGHRDG
jgi:hypothetical protein